MYSPLTKRNERKHKFTALLYTLGVIALLAGMLFLSGQLTGLTDRVKQYLSPDQQENEVSVQPPVAMIELLDHRGGNG